MTRFAPDFTKVSAGMKIFPRGDYELKVTKTKPIYYEKKDDEGDETGEFVAACQVNVEMVGQVGNDGQLDRKDEGESVAPLKLYIHSQKAWGMTKGMIMAILGYTSEEEKDFNAAMADTDFSVEAGEGEEAVLGGSWARLEGQHFVGRLDKRSYKGREQQDVGTLQPVKS